MPHSSTCFRKRCLYAGRLTAARQFLVLQCRQPSARLSCPCSPPVSFTPPRPPPPPPPQAYVSVRPAAPLASHFSCGGLAVHRLLSSLVRSASEEYVRSRSSISKPMPGSLARSLVHTSVHRYHLSLTWNSASEGKQQEKAAARPPDFGVNFPLFHNYEPDP